ncbi:type II toxin-antitoxin system VapC family toxin [Candidatus Micrarchaeota archaeon]|nr:type II toxin-antitoxin system VapC family toxin [Candidatus Micrarchaeota archaeon]
MNIVFDTSFLIQAERKNPMAISLGKKLIEQNFSFFISAITVSELMTGVYLRKDFEQARANALSLLGQFKWVDFNADIAFRTGEILAFLRSNKMFIEFQDAAIAATALEISAQYVVTENKKDFVLIPALKDKVFTMSELLVRL